MSARAIRYRLAAFAIVIAVVAMWMYFMNRLRHWGGVPPVPAWWPVSAPIIGHSMAYYLSLLLLLLVPTGLGAWLVPRLWRRTRD